MEKRRRIENRHLGVLGHGVYGAVHLVDYNGEQKALKLLIPVESEFDRPGSFRSACDYAREIYGCNNSKHLQGLLGCPKTGQLALLMPVFGDRLGNTTIQTHTVAGVAALLRPIAEYLSKTRGMHRDVKLSNILMPACQNQDAVLIDFSLATNMESAFDSNVITLWYRPPEVLMELEYNKKADIWSFGIVLFNLLCGTHLSRCANEENKHLFTLDILDKFGWPDWPEFYTNLQKHFGRFVIKKGHAHGTYDFYGALIQFPGAEPNECTIAADLLKKILKPKPDDRLSWAEIFCHPFWALADPTKKPFRVSNPEYKNIRDCDLFLEHALFYPVVYCDIWSMVTKNYSELNDEHIKMEIDLLDCFIFYGRKLVLNDSTIYYAYMIWRLARFKGVKWSGNEILSACLLLAASFNEDIRMTNFTWIKWFSAFDDTIDRVQKYPKTFMRILVFTSGHWPQKTFQDVYLTLSGTCTKANLLDSTQILYKTTALFLLASRDYTCEESVAQILQQVKGLVDAPAELNTSFEKAKIASSLAIEMSDK